MDKSNKYVEMCRKAKEVQERWKPAEGDFISIGKNIEIVGNVSEAYPDIINTTTSIKSVLRAYNRKNDNLVWLPNQDQLQEMLEPWEMDYQTIDKFNKFNIALRDNFKYYFYLDSYEQLWLAFVMHKKFKKKWDYDKKDWVSEDG